MNGRGLPLHEPVYRIPLRACKPYFASVIPSFHRSCGAGDRENRRCESFIALLAPSGARWIGQASVLLLGWFMFSIHYPLPFGSESVTVDLSLSLAASLVAITLCFLAVLHESRRCSTARRLDLGPNVNPTC